MVEEGAPIPVVAPGRAKSATVTYLSIPGYDGIGSTDTVAYIKDRVYYAPLYVRTPITIDQVTIEVTTAAGAGEKARAGIYDADKDWQPGALKVASAEMAIDAVAVVNTSITSTTLQEGRYLAAFNIEGNATFRIARYGLVIGLYTNITGNLGIKSMYVASAYGALADPGTAWDTVAAGPEGVYQPVYLRVTTP